MFIRPHHSTEYRWSSTVCICLSVGHDREPCKSGRTDCDAVPDIDSDGPKKPRKPPQYFTKPPRPTQPPTLSGTGNEYQPKCSDALWLGSKGMINSTCG